MTDQTSKTPIDRIHPSPTNPRKTFDEDGLAELADSIAELGILQPLVVRPHPDKADQFEIVAGERRYRASQIAGLDALPTIIKVLTDAEVLEIQLVENNQRADVHPLEEADAMAQLAATHGRTTSAIAERLGRSNGYVRRRLALADLIDPLREVVRAERIGIQSGRLLAKLPADLQRELARETIHLDATDWNDEPKHWRTSDVKTLIRRKTRRIARAPWDADAEYGEIRACHGCPLRSDSQTSLVPGLDEDARCLDGDCWQQKDQAWFHATREELNARGDRMLGLKKSAELFKGWWSQSEWVLLEEHPRALNTDQTWAELAPDSVTRYGALRKHWRGEASLVFLYRKQDVIDALEATGHPEKLQTATQLRGEKTDEELAAEKRQNIRRNRARQRRRKRTAQIIDHVDEHAFSTSTLARLAHAVLHKVWGGRREEVLARRFGLTEVDQPKLELEFRMVEAVEQRDRRFLISLTVELLVTETRDIWQSNDYSPRAAFLQLIGEDVDAGDVDRAA
jgi:ParB/RepB/Spo0J family partition protein